MSERVLITGSRSAAALDIARDFHSIGWEVHVADCTRTRISRYSRAVNKAHFYPSPVRFPDAFRERLHQITHDLKPAIIIPTCEEVFHLAAPELHDRLKTIVFYPSPDVLRTLHDKYKFNSLCTGIGLPAPDTHLITAEKSLREYTASSREWVFKPCFSRFGEETMISPSADSLQNRRIGEGEAWVAQKRIHGVETSFYAVSHNGQITAFSAYTSKWRFRGGASIVFTPVDKRLHASLFVIAKKLANHLQLNGQFACDAIVDSEGIPWLIECNPRATSGVHFLSGSGALANAILNRAVDIAARQTPSLHLFPAMASFGALMAVRQARIKAWWATLREGRDVIGRPGDRLPTLGAFIDGSLFALSGALRGTSASAATTADIEWNGEDFS